MSKVSRFEAALGKDIRSLLNCAPYLPTCQRALHAYVLACLRALCAYVLTCQRVLRAYVLLSQRALRAFYAYVPTFSRAITTNNKNKFQ